MMAVYCLSPSFITCAAASTWLTLKSSPGIFEAAKAAAFLGGAAASFLALGVASGLGSFFSADAVLDAAADALPVLPALASSDPQAGAPRTHIATAANEVSRTVSRID